MAGYFVIALAALAILAPAASTAPQVESFAPLQLDRLNDTVTISPVLNGYEFTEHTILVSIGNPPQVLNMKLSTTHADFRVYSDAMPKYLVSHHKLYNPDDSKSAEWIEGAYWNDSKRGGPVYRDSVEVGQLITPHQVVQTVREIVLTEKSLRPDREGHEGELGLAFGSRNLVEPVKQKTWLENMTGDLEAPTFTVELYHERPGRFTFGAMKTPSYINGITYTAVDNEAGLWGFTTTGWAIGDGIVYRNEDIPAIIALGSPFTMMPEGIVRRYWENVDGAKRVGPDKHHFPLDTDVWIYPCNSELPDFFYGVEDIKIHVPNYLIGMKFKRDHTTECVGALQSHRDDKTVVLGDSFLKPAFVVFDAANPPRIGFAPKDAVNRAT
ncbi:aspartic peptidase domain-containing protein [Pseudomassariella vexata]|uniref:Aspartic peptidase domain-containing protein n=1 Tax=Pseudomassariella vexata TaxID=1141098 RepID=A0A1Y2DBI8_9PEZI|nr:aspartic peptidase domain-containing protein [Pseudomassariella vexata]ORY56630.1 aspartic peptidase domain-containing protein [Pseudomassariella vexata]